MNCYGDFPPSRCGLVSQPSINGKCSPQEIDSIQ